MAPLFAVGDWVQTTVGKGIVREVRRHGRLLVEVKGRGLEIEARLVRPVETRSGRSRATAESATPARTDGDVAPARERAIELDLHGLTVEEALTRVDVAINDALISDRAGLRIVHGRTGGRIRGAVHRRLRAIAAVRAFHLDPRNPGVTIVIF